MTETITIIRHCITAQDIIDVFLDDGAAEGILVYLTANTGERVLMGASTIEIDVVNPKVTGDADDVTSEAVETLQRKADKVLGDHDRWSEHEPERVVSDDRKAEQEKEVDSAGASGAQHDDQDAGTVAEEDEPERDAAASDDGAIGKRYFYNADDDKLIVTADGSTPSVVEEPETSADWTEVDASEGEQIEAELAKQGDLLGGGAGDHDEKPAQKPEEKPEEDGGEKGEEKDDKPKGGKLAQRAGILSNEKAFWKFLGEAGGEIKSAEEAADALRNYCDIESRKILDEDSKAGKEAAHRFKRMERDYKAWLES